MKIYKFDNPEFIHNYIIGLPENTKIDRWCNGTFLDPFDHEPITRQNIIDGVMYVNGFGLCKFSSLKIAGYIGFKGFDPYDKFNEKSLIKA